MNYKKVMTINLMVILTIISFSCKGVQKKIISNTGFEKSIRGWLIWPRNTKVRCELDKSVYKTGHSSVRLTATNVTDKAILYANIKIKGKKNYLLTFWYKQENLKISSSGLAKVTFNFKKEGGNGSAGAITFDLPISVGNTDWKLFSREFNVPENATAAQFQLIHMRGITGSILLDDVEIKEVTDKLNIYKTAQAPRINGILDENCWKKATPLIGFYRINYRATPANMQTTAYVCYDDNNIYIAFKNTEPQTNNLKIKNKKRDSSVYNDDCNEIFIASPNGKIRQFAVNAANAKWDGELYIKMAGDPYQTKSSWNGKWKSAAKIGKNKWITEIAIPFSNFNDKPKGEWRINLARERHGAADELSHWGRVDGSFNNVNKFSTLKFSDKSANLSRFTETIITDPFAIKRKITKFKELLSKEKGNYIVGSWAHSYRLGTYQKDIQAKYSPAQFQREREEIFKETGLSGMFGPAFPWIEGAGGMDKIRELNREYGMKFPFIVKNSSLNKKAIKNGAIFVNYVTETYAYSDSIDLQWAKTIHNFLKNYLTERSDVIPYLLVVNGDDEPANQTCGAFSLTANPKNKKNLEDVDAKIKKDFGFGKFGLYDCNASVNKNTPFNHIAFWSWWSEQYYKIRNKDFKVVKELAPKVPYLLNMNSCGYFNYQDFTRISFAVNFMSCDPYPTSAMASHGRNRALYHTGFATKLIHDIVAPGVKTCTMPQAFVYHGRGCTPDNVREWASQAMKNGASMLYWYTSGPFRVTIPDSYKEMLRINNLVRSMNKLKIPEKSVTVLFFSQNARRGIMDLSQYSLYTLYVILGEKLKTWFRFVNETMLKMNIASLDSYRLIYVPELKYVDSETAGKFLNFVKDGGILVLFDPESFKWNINGTRMDDFRNKLVGAPIGKPCIANDLILSKNYLGLKQGTKLPLSKVRGRKHAGEILAFDIKPPKDANIFATYPDGKPAAYERIIGKGKVIYFAAQPFGNAELAVHKSSWKRLFSGLAKEVGEPENLDIWNFLLPAKGGEVEVKYVIQPPK